MLQHGWVSKHYVEQKNPEIKVRLTVWFSLYETQAQAKLIDRNQKNGCLSVGVLKRAQEAFSGDGDVLHIDLGDSYMKVYICQNSSNCTLKISSIYFM